MASWADPKVLFTFAMPWVGGVHWPVHRLASPIPMLACSMLSSLSFSEFVPKDFGLAAPTEMRLGIL